MGARARRLASPLGAAGLVAAATLALAVRDPHRPGSWGWCPTQLLTHLDCPACGSLRAVHDLTRLDLGAAASSNLLLMVVLPVVLVLWLRRVVAVWRGAAAERSVAVPAGVWMTGLAVMAAFTVARNLPGSWLAA